MRRVASSSRESFFFCLPLVSKRLLPIVGHEGCGRSDAGNGAVQRTERGSRSALNFSFYFLSLNQIYEACELLLCRIK